MEQEVKQEKILLTVEETAALLGISPRTIYNKTAPSAKEKFPVKPKRIGGAIRFFRRDLDEYIASL